MATKTEWTGITVYWDEQDPHNIGWAYQAGTADGHNESGEVGIDTSASLNDAVDQACHELGVDLDHNDFGRHDPLGHAVWERID